MAEEAPLLPHPQLSLLSLLSPPIAPPHLPLLPSDRAIILPTNDAIALTIL
jgi:hypothetical protein